MEDYENQHIVLNRIRTPDNTILTSRYSHEHINPVCRRIWGRKVTEFRQPDPVQNGTLGSLDNINTVGDSFGSVTTLEHPKR